VQQETGRPGAGIGALVAVLVPALVAAGSIYLAGCATGARGKSVDFDRHRFSRVIQPFDQPGKIYYDVLFSPDYPADDAVAEQARLDWLKSWLAQRQLCPAGHEVAARRPFDYLEDNPAGYQQRWEVRCVAAAGR
jgi:hypothetical protein